MASPVTLKNSFETEGDLEHVRGTDYLAELASSVITLINAEDDGHTIDDLYMRHERIALGQDLLRHAYKPRLEQEHGVMAIIEPTEGCLFRRAEAGNTGGGVQTLSEVLRKAAESAQLAFNHDSGVTGVTTGLKSLDRRLGGLQPSDLMILSGRLSMGKTTLAANIGGNAARRHAQTQGRGLFHACIAQYILCAMHAFMYHTEYYSSREEPRQKGGGRSEVYGGVCRLGEPLKGNG
jgi:replicative DNA helicase